MIAKGCRAAASLHVADFDEVFGNLNGVEGCALANLVADEPERQAVGVGEVFADATHIDGVFAGEEEGHAIFLLLGVVHQDEAFAFGNCLANVCHCQRFFRFDPDGFGVGAE